MFAPGSGGLRDSETRAAEEELEKPTKKMHVNLRPSLETPILFHMLQFCYH